MSRTITRLAGFAAGAALLLVVGYGAQALVFSDDPMPGSVYIF
ncbi:MAG: hypothetical protein ACU0BS_05970 [Hasllibacter sp.]